MRQQLRIIAICLVVASGELAFPSAAFAACTSPSGAAGSLNWNSGTTSFQYCDGTTWQNFGVAPSFGAGTVGAPGWAVTGDTDTGLWAPVTNTLSISAGGVEVTRFNTIASGVNYLSITPGAAGTPATVTIGAAGSSTNVNIAVTPKGTGYTLLSGNVGIGTASPGSLIEADQSGSASNYGAIALYEPSISSGNDISLKVGAAAGSGFNLGYRYNSTAANTFGWLGLAGDAVGTGLTVLKGGNVSIGTANPLALLHTYSAITSPGVGEASGVGQIRIDNAASALTSAGGVEFKIAGDSNGYGSKIQAINSGGSQLVFAGRQASSTWSEYMRINSNGNVGIGTTNPIAFDSVARLSIVNASSQAGLDIAGAGEVRINLRNTSGATDKKDYEIGTGAVSGALTFARINDAYSTRTTYLTIADGGSVGIGTTVPASKLDVLGSHSTAALNSSTGSLATFTSDTTVQLQFGAIIGGTYAAWIQSKVDGQNAAYPIALQPAGGNVGIATTSPSYRLDVLGAAGTFAGHIGSNDTTSNAYFGRSDFGVYSTISSANGIAVQGIGQGTGGFGIYGTGSGTNSFGLYGYATSSSANAIGGLNNSSGYNCYIGTPLYSIVCSGPTSGVSDRRLKKDITPLKDNEGLSAIMKLEPVHYRWKDERMNKAHPEGEIGFIAQNVETVLPLLVSESPQAKDAPVKLEGGMQKSLQYDRLAAPLVKAVQELKADNDNLRQEVEELRREIRHAH
jgi:hypothetical protein